MIQYWRVLQQNPDFTRLWLAQVISLTGDWFNTIALSALLIRYFPENSGQAVSLLVLARFIPLMVVSPIAGVLVDRFNRQHLIIGSNLLRAVVVLGFLFALDDPSRVWLIYALTIVQFILSAVFEPAQSAMIPSVTREQDLLLANTLNSITWSVILAFGAAIGGIVAAQFGTITALIIDAITFLLAALVVMTVRSYRHETRPMTVAHREQTSFREGLRYLRAHPEVATALIVKGGNSVGNVDTLIPIFAQLFVFMAAFSTLSEQEAYTQLYMGFLFSAFGVGALIGPLIMNRFNDGSLRQLRRVIAVGFGLSMFSWLIIGTSGALLVLGFGLILRGMGGSGNWTYSNVIIQTLTPNHYLGRVFSLDMVIFQAVTILSTLIHGQLVDLWGLNGVRVIALGTFIFALPPLLMWGMVVRWAEQRDPHPQT
ncbi:MAG: MFS transporter [Anaerolineae bacterium]|jgi:MFS family permease|nr:MFS transporter [Anaerolineae bacterium]